MSEKFEQSFDEFFNELEGYSLRSERFLDDCEIQDEIARKRLMIMWLREAFKSGMEVNNEE